MDYDFAVRAKQISEKGVYNVYDLAEIVSVLRSEHGCPWDKVQTHKTLIPDMIEEAYEVVDAIGCESPEMLREELGDVLLQVVFHSDIEKDKNVFTLDDVADEVSKKLILRHPHVFGDVKAETAGEVLRNWDAIKKEEKKQETYTDTLKSVAKVFPALMRAQKLTKRVSRAGADFSDVSDVFRLLREKLDELETADAINENPDRAIGEFLMLGVNLSRLFGVDAEQSLADECGGLIRRFEEAEQNGEKFSEDTCAFLYN